MRTVSENERFSEIQRPPLKAFPGFLRVLKSVGSWLISWLEMIGINSQDVSRFKNVRTFNVSPFFR